MRREFPCGHVGKGAFCHRCRQAECEKAKKKAVIDAQKAVRAARVAELNTAKAIPGVEMDKIPQKIAEKAAGIVRAIQSGVSYMQFRGKRLYDDRSVITVPVGLFYRIIMREIDGSMRPLSVLSHGDYNNALQAGHLRGY